MQFNLGVLSNANLFNFNIFDKSVTIMNAYHLEIGEITSTLHRLSLRISDRFPESSLHKISVELKHIAGRCEANAIKIRKPYYIFRIAFSIIIFLAGLITYLTFRQNKFTAGSLSIGDFFQSSEALINELALIGAALYFLFRLEDSLKEKIILSALHDLRAIAHVIDMHQLTKSPAAIYSEPTVHSPIREFTDSEIERYLNYCSELLSISSKIAAFYTNETKSPVVLQSVNDIEMLTTSMSRKIWQKIILLDARADNSKSV